MKEFSDDYNALQKADPGRDILFFEAPTVVFISTPIEAPTKFSQIDCGIAAQNMALAAHSIAPGQRHPRPAHGRVQERKGAALRTGLCFPEGYTFAIAVALGEPTLTKEAHVVREGLVTRV